MSKYLILGAGASGLAFANRLKYLGQDSFLVLEKEYSAGGLCRSLEVDGAPLDIGGGHFLDTCRPEVNEFLFQFMPESEWNKYSRISKIFIHEGYINSPIESNIWQMDIERQIEYLKSIIVAGCNVGNKKPEKFVDWIFWKLGDKIANDYMLPYNQKMFADELDKLGTYWLKKLPDVSVDQTLRSCLERKAYGKQPGHAQFYYPKKYGYGELWERMADNISKNIIYNVYIKKIDFDEKIVIASNGDKFSADFIINTIPWKEFDELKGMPEELQFAIRELKHSSIETRYFPENLNTDAHWIYYPDKKLPYHRILVRHNFCSNSKGYWTETRKERTSMFPENGVSEYCYLNEYAYPLNTLKKPMIMQKLLGWAKRYSVYGLGRWGEHQHYNSDVTVERAMKLAEELS